MPQGITLVAVMQQRVTVEDFHGYIVSSNSRTKDGSISDNDDFIYTSLNDKTQKPTIKIQTQNHICQL